MKQTAIFSSIVIILAISFLALSGCMSIPSSPTPRFYMLKPIDKGQVKDKLDISPDLIIGLGPIKIPEYLNRPQIVTFDKEGMLNFSQFERWGETLDVGLVRLIREDLMALAPNLVLEKFPWNMVIPVDYQVIVDVIKIDAQLDKDLILEVQWSVVNLRGSKERVFVKRSEFRQPINPNNYSGLTQALSSACAELSREIINNLVSLTNLHKAEGNPVDSKKDILTTK